MDVDIDDRTPLLPHGDDRDPDETSNPFPTVPGGAEGGEHIGLHDLTPRGAGARPREPGTTETSTSINPVTGRSIDTRLLDSVREDVRRKFPRVNGVEIGLGEKGRVMIRRWEGENPRLRPLYTKDGTVTKNIPNELKEALGTPAEQILEENNAKTQELEQQNRQDEETRDAPDTSPEDRRAVATQISAREEEIEELAREGEAVEERMSLRNNVKAVLKKYGFTVLGVIAAAGTVIGVILGILQRRLAGVARGLGRGLKTIGKKLGALLPGAIGAIASFLFRTKLLVS